MGSQKPSRSAEPAPAAMFGQIHDAAYEMTALATNADAKLLGYLLMMVAEEAERLAWTDKIENGGPIERERPSMGSQ